MIPLVWCVRGAACFPILFVYMNLFQRASINRENANQYWMIGFEFYKKLSSVLFKNCSTKTLFRLHLRILHTSDEINLARWQWNFLSLFLLKNFSFIISTLIEFSSEQRYRWKEERRDDKKAMCHYIIEKYKN